MTRRDETIHTRTARGPSERLDLHPQSPWWGEHRSRYRLAQEHVAGATVLDIACGTGFGIEMLADAGARRTVGVDLEYDALVAAGRSFAGPRRFFVTADGTALPFQDGSFDLVTSFETLEHVSEGEPFVAELHRVLAPGGLLVLSTPNRAYTEMNGHQCENPFHLREYERSELFDLLSPRFRTVELRGQRLSPEYRISPFASDHQRLPYSALTRARLVWWKVQNKLPFVVKDPLSRLVAGHPFYPCEEHYLFEDDITGFAHVLVALCRR
jgi:SAM-dependent methyltransferase